MSETPPEAPGLWRRVTAWYARLLSGLLMVSIAILVIPVTLQIFSRFEVPPLPSWLQWLPLSEGPILPHYIWTEEMARFLFIWTIMIGAMIALRESLHFEVDVWPRVKPRIEATVKLVSKLGVLAFALVFVWAGIEFTEFAWNRISELAELPLWLIHVAWPLAGVTWVVFLGEQFVDDLRVILGRNA